MTRFFLPYQQYIKKLTASLLIIFSYWFLIQLINHYISVDGVINLISPAAGIGLVTILLYGYQVVPLIVIGSFLAYSPINILCLPTVNFSLSTIISLSVINGLQAFIGAFWLKRLCDLSKGINSVKDFYLLWFIGGYLAAFIGAILSTMTLYFSNDISLTYNALKTTLLWWQGNAVGIPIVATILLILLTSKPIKNWTPSKQKVIEFILLFGITFISGQAIFLGWYAELLGALSKGYWFYFFISIAAIRFGKQGVVLILLMGGIQAFYGAVQQVGFFGKDIEVTNLANLWASIQILAFVGMLQAIVIENRNKQASFDDLTQLPNRRLFMTSLHSEIYKANRNQSMFGLIFIDLDRFKQINDTLGHHIGDELLQAVTSRLKKGVRESDIISRLGGDEFTIIVPDINDITHLDTIAKKIIHIVHAPFQLAGQKIFITISAGVTVYPNDSSSAEELIRFADQAMYSAKSNGKNRFHYFTAEMQEKIEMKNNLMRDLYAAMNSDQLSMYYQPIVDVKSGKFAKAEALIRWDHPEKGYITPEVFIAIAEETGHISALGDWIVENVLTQLADWRRNYDTDLVVAINISPLQFMNTVSNQKIRETIRQLEIPAEQIILEITEGVLLEGHIDLFNEFKHFCDFNIKLAVDDFGTGYSSLAYIKKFPIDFLKIDRSFINDIEDNKDSKALVKAIIAMSDALEMNVVAEGVETIGQLQILEELGCNFIQGYFYSKPLNAIEFAKYLH